MKNCVDQFFRANKFRAVDHDPFVRDKNVKNVKKQKALFFEIIFKGCFISIEKYIFLI
jgi:hypothetical protein